MHLKSAPRLYLAFKGPWCVKAFEMSLEGFSAVCCRPAALLLDDA